MITTIAEAIASVDGSLTSGYNVDRSAALVLRDHARDHLDVDPVPDAMPTDDAAERLEKALEDGRLVAAEQAAVRSLIARARAGEKA